MDEEILRLVRLNVVRDIEIALLKEKNEGLIVPDEVFNIIKKVEKTY